MDSKMRQAAIQDRAKKRFKGKKTLVCRVHPRHPESAEREFQRTTNAYMRLLSGLVKETMIPEIRKAANAELEPGYYNTDGMDDLYRRLERAFARCEKRLIRMTSSFDLRKRIEEVAALTVKLSVKDWKRMVKETIGIDILEDYYNGDFYKDALEAWTQENVDLIKTIPHEALSKMRDIVLDGYRNGKTTTQIVKEIQKEYGDSRGHARFIARDQISKLNSQITQKQQRDAGVSEYEWSDSGDSRVRSGHHRLNGHRFRWDDPPVVDDRTGRRCHPGEDYQCRCVALPVFDIDDLDL